MLKPGRLLMLTLIWGCLFIQPGYCNNENYHLVYSGEHTKVVLDTGKIKHSAMQMQNGPFLYYDIWTKWLYDEAAVQKYINIRKKHGRSTEGYENLSYSLRHSLYALISAPGASKKICRDIEIIDFDKNGKILADEDFRKSDAYDLDPHSIGANILFNTAQYCIEHNIQSEAEPVQPKNENTPPALLKIGDSIEGDEFQKGDGSFFRIEYSQKPTLLWFWADFTQKSMLIELLSVVQAIYENRGDQINIYTVNISGKWQTIADTMSNYSCTVPALKSQNYLRYSRGFPSVVIIDQNGIVRFREIGSMNIDELQALIDSILRG